MVTMRVAAKQLGLHPNTIRRYLASGDIPGVRSPSGKWLIDVEGYLRGRKPPTLVCYCRVSSAKQKEDLVRQVQSMCDRFPNAEIVKDVGSGLNYKRKGFISLLDRIQCGEKFTLVVAHRDRLVRFGFALIAHLVERNGGEILVLDDKLSSPEEELTRDLVSIINIFACRIHGLRRYGHKISKDTTLPGCQAETTAP